MSQASLPGIAYGTSLHNLRHSVLEMRSDLPDKEELLRRFQPGASIKLPIGSNTGDYCHPELARLLTSHPLIDDYDLSDARHINTDVLVIGGHKLCMGDSNTVMAEGSIQAAVGAEDSLQQHLEDTIKGGHYDAKN